MREKSTKWYFYKHPDKFLNRLCYDSHTAPMLKMGLVRGFRYERRKTKLPRYWVWVDCLDHGLPVSYRIGDDEVGYLDLGLKLLTTDEICETLNGSYRHMFESQEILGHLSQEYIEASGLYEQLVRDLPDILMTNGHTAEWDHQYVLTQHYLSSL